MSGAKNGRGHKLQAVCLLLGCTPYSVIAEASQEITEFETQVSSSNSINIQRADTRQGCGSGSCRGLLQPSSNQSGEIEELKTSDEASPRITSIRLDLAGGNFQLPRGQWFVYKKTSVQMAIGWRLAPILSNASIYPAKKWTMSFSHEMSRLLSCACRYLRSTRARSECTSCLWRPCQSAWVSLLAQDHPKFYTCNIPVVFVRCRPLAPRSRVSSRLSSHQF